MSRVDVQYFKHPDSLHWRHELYRLGEDAHGVWLGAAAGATLQRGAETAIRSKTSLVQLIRPGAWWTLIVNDARKIRFYIDIITPAVWQGDGLVTMVDLDLDVIQESDGTIYIDDADEFEEHQKTLAYPPLWVEKAPMVADEMVSRLEHPDEPFISVVDDWLSQARSL